MQILLNIKKELIVVILVERVPSCERCGGRNGVNEVHQDVVSWRREENRLKSVVVLHL